MICRYIAVDWGSTNLRAWLFQGEECLQSRQSEAGVTRLNGKTPEAVLADITDGWRSEGTPVVMAGMVGSNAGWKIAPYLPCPARFSDLSSHLMTVKPGVYIVPGMSIDSDDNHNVMRGEETQLLGASRLMPSSLYVMSGTHCKWVKASGDTVSDFRTVMTGELHHLLLNNSLIGVGIDAQRASPEAFRAGLEKGIASADLLPDLFEVRAAHVLEALPKSDVSEFLSGLLIGNEVADMVRRYQPDAAQPITIVAGPSLAERYRQALSLMGFSAQVMDGDAAFQAGIRSIAYAVAN